jgi:hypothetical protein
MRVVKVATKEGPHDDVSVCRSVDFGIPVFHRSGRCHRSKASSLNRVRDDGIPSGEQVVNQGLLDRFGFVIVKDIYNREKEKR